MLAKQHLFGLPVLACLVSAICVVRAGDDVLPATHRDISVTDARIEYALEQWEAASSELISPSAEDERVAYMAHKGECSGHEIAVAFEFQKPVLVSELLAKYRWGRIEASSGGILLTAEPIDDVEQLFYRGFDLTLDSKTKLPIEIRFIGRDGKRKSNSLELGAMAPHVENRLEVRLASAVSTKGRALHVTNLPPKQDQDRVGGNKDETSKDSLLIQMIWLRFRPSELRSTVDFEFDRHVFYSASLVEKVSRGRIFAAFPSGGRIDVEGIDVQGAQSKRVDRKTGKPFSLESDSTETLVWTGKYMMQFNPVENRVDYSKVSKASGKLISSPEALLHFVFECADGYRLKVLERDDLGIWISATPDPTTDASTKLNDVTVIFDPITLVPKHMKLVNTTDEVEVVYSFWNWKVNEPLTEKERLPQRDWRGYQVAPNLDVDDSDVDEDAPVVAPKPPRTADVDRRHPYVKWHSDILSLISIQRWLRVVVF